MSAKKNVSPVKDISPVLFFTDEGVPMEFYVRPGPSKQKLGPLITAGGGLLSKAQKPKAILLVDPEEKGSIPKTSATWYVSTQYIYDCVDKEAQLDVEDYRLRPEENEPSTSTASHSSKTPQGRMKYTPEEDAAILKYIDQYEGVQTRGNRLWIQMEKENLTSHTWQSMKDRYIRHISKRQMSVEKTSAKGEQAAEDKGKGEEEEEEGKEETSQADENPEDMRALTLSSDDEEDSDGTQLNMSANDKHSKDEEAQTSGSLFSPEAAKVPPESGTEENSAEEPHVDNPDNSTEPEPSQSLIDVGPVTQRPAPEPSPCSSTPTKTVVKPVRRSLRRRLSMDDTPPEAVRKRLRSSSSDVGLPSPAAVSSPQTTTVKHTPAEQSHTETSPSVEVEPHNEDSGESHAVGNDPMTQSDQQNREQRKLGILELAAAEFADENETEPMDEGSPDDVVIQPTPAESPVTPADEATTHPEPKPGPSRQENVSTSSPPCPPETSAAIEPVLPTCHAHMFIFDSESQVEQSQPNVTNHTTDPEQDLDEGFALTQAQLDEDMQWIRKLMEQSGRDLVHVTKALLQTSGDFSAALSLLTSKRSFPKPFWSRNDDQLLLSADPEARSKLQKKHGEQNVAKRILFLEVEG